MTDMTGSKTVHERVVYMKGRQYDLDGIKSSVDIREVLEHFGYNAPINRNMKCPGADHDDNNPSAHIYMKSNRCTCFACGRSFSNIDVVMENSDASTWQEACDYLIDNFDCNGLYEDASERKDPTERFPLSRSDIRELGLSTASSSTVSPVTGTAIRQDLYILWKEDRNACKDLIARKALEQISNVREDIEEVEKDIRKSDRIIALAIHNTGRDVTLDDLMTEYKSGVDYSKPAFEYYAIREYYIREDKELKKRMLTEKLARLKDTFGRYKEFIDRELLDLNPDLKEQVKEELEGLDANYWSLKKEDNEDMER